MPKNTPTDDQLLKAVEVGDLNGVRKALAGGANPNAKKGKKSALDFAGPRAHEIRCELIDAGARHTSLKKSLVWAVSQGRPSTVRALIEYGADINLVTPIGTPIMAACENGCDDSFQLLLDAGCDLGLVNSMNTPLSKAIESGRSDLVKRLLDAGCDPEQTPQYGGYSPLLVAVEKNCLNSLSALVDAGADVNKINDKVILIDEQSFKMEEHPDSTALHFAACLGRSGMVAKLLAVGADAKLKDGQGQTALHWADTRGHAQVARMLSQVAPKPASASPNETLRLSIEGGDLEGVKKALADGADIEHRDPRTKTKNYTPLLLASSCGHPDIVQYLCAQGAEVNVTEKADEIPKYLAGEMDEASLLQMGYTTNRTPLLWALVHKQGVLAAELISLGANTDCVSNLREKAMLLAAPIDDPELLELLHTHGCKADEPGRDKETPLMRACEFGALKSAEWLLEHKAKLTKKNSEGSTPLMVAAGQCRTETVKFLLEKGAKQQYKAGAQSALICAISATKTVALTEGVQPFISTSYGDDGATTLAPLCEDRVLEVAKLLLEAGADPNHNGMITTCLGAAAQCGHLRVAQLLIEKGANPNKRDTFGELPVDSAKMFGRPEVEKYLRSLSKNSKKPKPDDSWEDDDSDEREMVMAKIPKFGKKLQSKKFKKTVDSLAARCQSEPTYLDNHVEIHVDSSLQDQLSILELQDEILEFGYFLVDCSGSTEKPVKLAIFPTKHWQDALAVIQTNGCNYNVGSQDIIDWLERWESDNPCRILGLRHDLVSGIYPKKLKKPKSLAKSMLDLCPDTVEQGFGSLEELTQHLKKERNFFMWWD